MIRRIVIFIILIACVTSSIYAGYYFANKEICVKTSPYASIGHLVLTTEESKKLYDLNFPIDIPIMKIRETECRRGVLW